MHVHYLWPIAIKIVIATRKENDAIGLGSRNFGCSLVFLLALTDLHKIYNILILCWFYTSWVIQGSNSLLFELSSLRVQDDNSTLTRDNQDLNQEIDDLIRERDDENKRAQELLQRNTHLENTMAAKVSKNAKNCEFPWEMLIFLNRKTSSFIIIEYNI